MLTTTERDRDTVSETFPVSDADCCAVPRLEESEFDAVVVAVARNVLVVDLDACIVTDAERVPLIEPLAVTKVVGEREADADEVSVRSSLDVAVCDAEGVAVLPEAVSSCVRLGSVALGDTDAEIGYE